MKVTTEKGREIDLNLEQICYFDYKHVTMSNGVTISLSDQSLKEVETAIAKKDRQTKNTDPDKEMLELFEKLHKLTGGKGKPVFSLQREKKLKALLTTHRMTPELLVKAATNIGKDDFLQGRDPNNESKKRYGDVDYLLRPDKAAKWAEDQTEKKKSMF